MKQAVAFMITAVSILPAAPGLHCVNAPSMLKPVARRTAFAAAITAATVLPSQTAETVGKDPACNENSCLGVWDGLLADCPHTLKSGAGCVSSQDDTPGVFAEPWDYSEDSDMDEDVIIKRLIKAVQSVSSKRGDTVRLVQQQGRYLRVAFADGRSEENSVGEFYLTQNDTTVQFRLGSMGSGSFTSLKNMDRSELIRKELGFLKLPVLRNRKRSLIFVESDLDTFGPGSASLGPPAEMSTGELDGRQNTNPKLKIDLLQRFPLQSGSR